MAWKPCHSQPWPLTSSWAACEAVCQPCQEQWWVQKELEFSCSWQLQSCQTAEKKLIRIEWRLKVIVGGLRVEDKSPLIVWDWIISALTCKVIQAGPLIVNFLTLWCQQLIFFFFIPLKSWITVRVFDLLVGIFCLSRISYQKFTVLCLQRTLRAKKISHNQKLLFGFIIIFDFHLIL